MQTRSPPFACQDASFVMKTSKVLVLSHQNVQMSSLKKELQGYLQSILTVDGKVEAVIVMKDQTMKNYSTAEDLIRSFCDTVSDYHNLEQFE